VSAWIDQVRFDGQGLVTAVAQDHLSHRILMVAHMNREALQETLATGEAVYFSRSRQRLWRKGESSGHVQRVHEIRLDCDGDVVLMQVTQGGGIACHTGRVSCFYLRWENGSWQAVDPVVKDPKEIYAGQADAGQAAASPVASAAPTTLPSSTEPQTVLGRLADAIAERRGADPEKSYVARLLHRAPDAVLKKIGEEATETVMACKDGLPERIVSETADLWFHCLVMLEQHGLRPEAVLAELMRREGLSGLDEKAARQAEARQQNEPGAR
jgi:phosphoribosyl-ATP pyrophosphohydrolase/phosphoribosyl-AMP cyclohydrolase